MEKRRTQRRQRSYAQSVDPTVRIASEEGGHGLPRKSHPAVAAGVDAVHRSPARRPPPATPLDKAAERCRPRTARVSTESRVSWVHSCWESGIPFAYAGSVRSHFQQQCVVHGARYVATRGAWPRWRRQLRAWVARSGEKPVHDTFSRRTPPARRIRTSLDAGRRRRRNPRLHRHRSCRARG